MTIEEAINHAKKVSLDKRSEKPEHVIGLFDDSDCQKCAEQHEQLAEWLEELQQYRAIGIVDYINEAILLTKADETLLSEYKAIGTIEECRKAKEKQTPKKPNIWGDGYDDKGNMIYDTYDCPNCGKSYELDYQEYKYCPECGQAIDWSEKKN